MHTGNGAIHPGDGATFNATRCGARVLRVTVGAGQAMLGNFNSDRGSNVD